MALDSLLATLKNGVTGVAGVQPNSDAGLRCNTKELDGVAGVRSAPASSSAATPATPRKIAGVTPELAWIGACTPATPVTPENDNPSGEAQPVAPEATDAPPEPDPDRWCWPHSDAMNTAEIAIFEARIHLFGARGLDLKDAEAMADRLTLRDRGADERRLCFECQHLQVLPENHWRAYVELRCGNWLAAGLCVFARDAGLSEAMTRQLQRCDGFKAAAHPS
jgi:hypothetical protein